MNVFIKPKELFFHSKFLKIAFVTTSFLFTVSLLQDYIRSAIHHSSYYFSESILFSSFWLLFIPLLVFQLQFFRRTNNNSATQKAGSFLCPILAHIIIYPLLVWFISAAFYDHTFSILQTLRYTLSEQFYLLLVFYSLPVLIINRAQKELKNLTKPDDVKNDLPKSLLVTEHNRQTKVNLSEIVFIKANTPYLNLHLGNKKYLHKESLRSFSYKLNKDQFLQIHRSTIINIKEVQSFASRHNGDYDLRMKDATVLRLSRNYVQQFKILYNSTHRVSP